MNKEKMLEEMGGIRPEFVEEARPKMKKKQWFRIGAAAAAIIAAAGAAIVIPKLIKGGKTDLQKQHEYNVKAMQGYIAAAPAEVTFPQNPIGVKDLSSEQFRDMDNAWYEAYQKRMEAAKTAADTGSFAEKLFKELAAEHGSENLAFSPANIYIALGMLAEITDGDTRAEILTALGAPDMDSLRTGIRQLIEAESNEDGLTFCRMADSLWLNKSITFKADALNILAEVYRASSFWGDPMDKDFEKALQAWLDDNTGGMLKESAEKITIDPNLIIALASTIHFKADWSEEFTPEATCKEAFRAPGGDVECDMMHLSDSGVYLKFDGFAMASKELKGHAGHVWFILPDEGKSFADIDIKAALDAMKADRSYDESCTIRFAVPRIDVTSDIDLVPAVQKLGICACFEPGRADFSPLTDELKGGIYVSSIDHSARMTMDEYGVEAAAFTVIQMESNSMLPPDKIVDFTLDRPFITVITGATGEPLFITSVVDPTR